MEGVIALGCRAEGHTCRRGAWEYVCVDAAITIEQHDDCNEEVNEKQEDDKMAGHALVCLHLPYKEATQTIKWLVMLSYVSTCHIRKQLRTQPFARSTDGSVWSSGGLACTHLLEPL